MAIGKRRDAWERAAAIRAGWTGERIDEIMPDFGDTDTPAQRADVLPFDEELRAQIIKNWQGGVA